MIKFVVIILFSISIIPVFGDEHSISSDFFLKWKSWAYDVFDWHEYQISELESENKKLNLQITQYNNKISELESENKKLNLQITYSQNEPSYNSQFKTSEQITQDPNNENMESVYYDHEDLDKIVSPSISQPIVEQCIDEFGFFVNPSITILAIIQDDVLKIEGSGINPNIGFSDQAVISLSSVNDYSGANIHFVEVKSNGKFTNVFDISDVFYDDYVYNNIEYSGNIDPLGNYKIEIQYDKQCGFTTLDFDYEPNYPDESKSVEVEPYNVPIPSNNANQVSVHRSHVEIIEIDVNVSCMDNKSSCFTPDRVVVPVGSEIIFVVNDGNGHMIAQGTDRSKPYDGEFRVDNLVRGGSFSHVFHSAGEYPYFSNIHNNAEGIIIVE